MSKESGSRRIVSSPEIPLKCKAKGLLTLLTSQQTPSELAVDKHQTNIMYEIN